MAKEMDVLAEFLGKKRLKLTRQRRVILEAFLRTGRHVSADDLYDIVRKSSPEIGHATVFRTLKLLSESGIAKEADLGGRKRRYERKYGHKNHVHLVCVMCGWFIEVVDGPIERHQKRLCRKAGFAPRRLKMEVYGVCSRCGRKGAG